MMKKIHCFTLLLIIAVFVTNCSNNKPKPKSNNITKTTIMIDGKKDSVINNPKKNYGTATISDPCTKLLLQNIQASDNFKSLTAGKQVSNISYTINWVKAAEPKIRSNGGKITNGIELAVNEKKDQTKMKIGSYIYNNEDAKLYDVNKDGQYDEVNNVDSAALKRIRNGCYWGVASHN